MSDWFSNLASRSELSMDAASELRERGFVVLRDSVSSERMERLAIAYNGAVAWATSDDVHIGNASTRVADFVNRGPEFDEFRSDNGATRFVPGSHLWPGMPADTMSDVRANHPGQVLACGAAGSLLI